MGQPGRDRGVRRSDYRVARRDLHQVEAHGPLLADSAASSPRPTSSSGETSRVQSSETQVRMPDSAWKRLNWSWTGFFAFMGAANLYVALNFATDTWVNFKLFGGMGLMLLFVIGQALYLGRHMKTEEVREP